MSKQTPLHAEHVAAGAKIVDFAGWDMPIHYGSQLDEHKLVRADAGMFDVSHMLPVDIAGAGARDFLRHLIANDVAKLKNPGKALYSCMLKADGGILDDLIVYRFADDDYRIVVNAGTADKDVAWMRDVARSLPGGGNVNITPRRDLAIIAVQGPKAREKYWSAFPSFKSSCEQIKPFQAVRLGTMWGNGGSELERKIIFSTTAMIGRTGYTGEDGFEFIFPANFATEVWHTLLAAGVKPAGLGARDTLRLEAGMALYGQDMDESINPYEAGLAWTVDLRDTERDFIGRTAITAQAPTLALVGLVLEDRGVLRSHMRVFTPQGEGQTTSGSFAPSMNASIAFARVPVGLAAGEHVEVEIRDKRLKARVVVPPFVRNGQVLV